MGVYENPSKMWFGTESKMSWIEVPQTGADVSPVGMSASAQLLNGGAFQRNSWGSHKTYDFSWGNSVDRQTANLIHGYANGTYGRGLIYFQDPMWYETNVLPRHIADPSMALNYEAPQFDAGLDAPTSTPTPANTNDLPVQTAVYTVPAGYATDSSNEVVIPVPEGMTLVLGAIYSATGTARLVANGIVLDQLGVNAPLVATQRFSGPWVRLGVIGGASGGTVSITGSVGRLVDDGALAPKGGPWVSGEGNTGCRFVGKPTLVNYGGLFGGQVGLSATLVEVGAWV